MSPVVETASVLNTGRGFKPLGLTRVNPYARIKHPLWVIVMKTGVIGAELVVVP